MQGIADLLVEIISRAYAFDYCGRGSHDDVSMVAVLSSLAPNSRERDKALHPVPPDPSGESKVTVLQLLDF